MVWKTLPGQLSRNLSQEVSEIRSTQFKGQIVMAKKKAVSAKKPTAAPAKAKKTAVKKSSAKKVAAKSKASKKASAGSPPAPASPAMQAVDYLSYLYANPEHAYVNAVRVLERNRKLLADLSPNIIGAEVGLKEFADTRLRVFAIRVLVKKKFCAEAMIKSQEPSIPPEIEGIPTDVVKPCRFVEAGVKPGDAIYVRTPKPGTGTLGAQVEVNGIIHYLTAAHVISSQATGRLTLREASGTSIGAIDTSKPTLWKKTREIDAALVEAIPSPSPRVFLRNADGFLVDQLGVATPNASIKGLAVWKRGQKTGPTEGKILVPDSGPRVVDGGSGSMTVDRQIVVISAGSTRFADQGDSGAVVIADRKAIGIIRAVSDGVGPSGLHETLVTPFSEVIGNISKFDLV